MNIRMKVLALAIVFAINLCWQNGFAAGEVVVSPMNVSDVPMGQSKTGEVSLLPEDVGDVSDEDLFGMEGGYFHPYVSISFDYTDNLYNLDDSFEDGGVENLLTTVSPGIWFALPRKKIIPVTINPNNSSPGGLQLQFKDYEGTDRFQAYALGGFDFKYYTEDSDLNKTDGLLEGMGRYNMRGGLSLQLVDRYTHGEDRLEAGSSTRNQVRQFDSNFLMATADWDITEKLRVKADYLNFALWYDDEINQFLDRVDNGFDLYGYFNYSLLTSFFLEYKFIDVAYDQSTQIDNNSHFIYGGIKWDTTEKVAMLFKVGYQNKKFDDNSIGQEDFDGIAFDLQFTYRYSEKTTMSLDMYRTNEETDNFQASDKTVIGSVFGYKQKFTDRLSGSFDFTYEDSDYSNLHTVTAEDRDDWTIDLRPAGQYLFRDWLMFELAYQYERRESTDDFFDYDSNSVIFTINLAL